MFHEKKVKDITARLKEYIPKHERTAWVLKHPDSHPNWL
jgi:hypothetical protein